MDIKPNKKSTLAKKIIFKAKCDVFASKLSKKTAIWPCTGHKMRYLFMICAWTCGFYFINLDILSSHSHWQSNCFCRFFFLASDFVDVIIWCVRVRVYGLEKCNEWLLEESVLYFHP